jgi:hypothetical protein
MIQARFDVDKIVKTSRQDETRSTSRRFSGPCDGRVPGTGETSEYLGQSWREDSE